jgi:dTDP-L-rhamnose 4-epimerase
VDLLLEKGYQVRVLDGLLPPVHADGRVPDYVPLDDVEFIRGDVRDRAAWERSLEGVEAVFHLAAYQDYLPDFSTFFHTNTVSTALLYELIVEKRLPVSKVVVASSQAVYGEGKYHCTNDQYPISNIQYPSLREDSQLRRGDWDVKCPQCGEPMEPQWTDEAVVNPHNQYAISKYTQEMVALNLGQRYGIPTVCMRYSIVQGARQSFRNTYSGVLRIFTQRLLNGKPPVCYEDGQQLRDYVSVHDVTRANLLVLEDDRADFQVFNVGGDRQVTVLEYAHLIAQRAGADIESQVPGLYRFGDTRHVFSDVSKLKALGWEPAVPLEAIVDEYIAWAQAQSGFRDYYAEAKARMEEMGTLRRVEGGGGKTEGERGS